MALSSVRPVQPDQIWEELKAQRKVWICTEFNRDVMACVCQWAGKKKALCQSGSLWESPELIGRYCSLFSDILILVKNTYCVTRTFYFILLFTFRGRNHYLLLLQI